MKYLLFLLSLIVSLPSLASANDPETDCRRYRLQGEFASEKARMASDLVTGVWNLRTERLGVSQGRILFHEFGAADEILSMPDGSLSYERLNWTLEEYNGAVFLVVSHLGRAPRTNLYRMSPNCEGIDLTDAGSLEQIALEYSGRKAESVQAMAHQLTGAWSVEGYPFEIARSLEECGTFEPFRGAFLEYAFWENGTFVRDFGHEGVSRREKGYWDISADGRYLLLHVQDAKDSSIVRTDVARIEEMGDGTLRVRQTLTDADGLFCTQPRIFSFGRWAAKG